MKKYLFTLLASLVFTVSQAQSDTPASIWEDPAILFYIVSGFLLVVVLLVLAVAVYMLQVINFLARKEAMERASKEGKTYTPEPTLWQKLWQGANDFVPVEKEAAIMLDHNYDGIKELDNHLPPWWKWLFYGTIIWSVFYMIAYHVTDSLPLSTSEYDTEVAVAEEQIRKMKAANPAPAIDESNMAATTDVKALTDGKQTFMSICASCHKTDGGGDIGPNLTDEYWKHGGSIQDIYKVVKAGVPGTNMVAWGGSLSPEKMLNVSSYVLTLQGTNPANAKKPEGTLYQKPAAPETKSDSVKTQASL